MMGLMMTVSVGAFGTENLPVSASNCDYVTVCSLTKSISVSMGGSSGRLFFTFS